MSAKSKLASLKKTVANLKIGDIVFIHTRRKLRSQIIRRVTGSYWNHVALVFAISPHGRNLSDILLVEALDRGIEIHRLQRYLARPDLFELGIKRLQVLTNREREKFRGFFLESVDAPYDFNRLFAFLLREPVRRFFGRRLSDWIANWLSDVDSYICTSFAQRAFYRAASREKRDLTLFLPSGTRRTLRDRMEHVAPGDIARSRNTIWLFNPHI